MLHRKWYPSVRLIPSRLLMNMQKQRPERNVGVLTAPLTRECKMSDTNETPLGLRGLEARLRSLRPARSPELLQAVVLFSAICGEKPSLSIPSDSFPQFSRFVRRAQFRAGTFGAFVGMLYGVVLGGLCVYFAMNGAALRPLTPLSIGRALSAQMVSTQTAMPNDVTDMDIAGSAHRIIRYYTRVADMSMHFE